MSKVNLVQKVLGKYFLPVVEVNVIDRGPRIKKDTPIQVNHVFSIYLAESIPLEIVLLTPAASYVSASISEGSRICFGHAGLALCVGAHLESCTMYQ